jgi:hypothetical protein
VLQIKPHHFLRNGDDRAESLEALNPGQDVLNATLDRRCEPVLAPGTVLEPGRAIAGFALSSSPTNATTFQKTLPDLLSSMGEFSCKHDFACRIVDDSDSGGIAPWIKLDPQ